MSEKQQRGFDQAVHQMDVAAAWHPDDGLTPAQLSAGLTSNLVPLALYHSLARPMDGTVVVHLHVAFPHGRIPNNFLNAARCKSIVLLDRGTVVAAGDNWRGNCTRLARVAMLSALASVGSGWLSLGSYLSSFDVDGLPALARVGDHWLFATRLGTFDSTALQLTALTAVDSWWLSGGLNLTAFDAAGLTALTSVGNDWVSASRRLARFDARGLVSLTSVGRKWLWHTPVLTHFDAGALGALASVGDDWLRRSTALQRFDGRGLAALATVGAGFLEDCTALAVIDVDPSTPFAAADVVRARSARLTRAAKLG